MKKITSGIICLIIDIVAWIFFDWLFLPAHTFASNGFWWYIILMIAFTIGLFLMWDFINEFEVCDEHGGIVGIGSLLAIGLPSVIMIIVAISSSRLTNAYDYQKLITVSEADFESDIASLGKDEISLVDMASAQRLGNRTMGQMESVTSQFEVDGEYNLIIYQGKQYRLSPLNYGGYWKFKRSKYDGIPGYVLVNTVTQEAELVKLDKGMKYSPSAYFEFDLKRHLRETYNEMFSTSYFEIDEDGNPYWITGILTPQIGLFGGKVITKVIITDAITGENTEYLPEEVPTWVDHVYPLDYLMDKISDSYQLGRGFWNSVFSKVGVKSLSYNYKDADFAGYNSMLTEDGVCFFTGVTSAGGDESIFGFILVNTRTGEVNYYSCPGAEESSAQSAAEGLVQNMGYKATYPTILNVGGVETYFMCLKDDALMIQRYALVNVRNYAVAVEASSFNEVVNLYLKKLNTSSDVSVVSETLSKTGVIENIYSATIEGFTYYYYKFVDDDMLYMSSISNSNKQVAIKTGDTVTIEYTNSNEDGVAMVTNIRY